MNARRRFPSRYKSLPCQVSLLCLFSIFRLISSIDRWDNCAFPWMSCVTRSRASVWQVIANKKEVIVKVSHTRAERARLSRLIVSERLSFIPARLPSNRRTFLNFHYLRGLRITVKPCRFFLEPFFVISTPFPSCSVENGFDPRWICIMEL